MSNRTRCAGAWLAAAITALSSAGALAADSPELSQLRSEIDRLRADYETRLKALESRLSAAEAAAAPRAAAAPPAPPAPAQTIALPAAPAQSAGAFNPAISLILSGGYTALKRDPATWRLKGFQTGGEIGPGGRGFSLAESELGIAANIDPWFHGSAAIAVAADDSVGVEEAFVQTTALPAGLKLRFGRFFSGLGYQNDQHAHVWDFVDAPLPYQAFLGGQRNEDGVQVRWLLPTDFYAELGGELGRGATFPGSDSGRNAAGAWTLFGHAGGDVGMSHSWRAGLSVLQAQPRDRESSVLDATGNEVSNAFSGRSRLWVADGVWKWAPNGNATRTNFKLQGEYFRRTESGTLTYDTATIASSDAYRSAQSGWTLQGVWQFMPAWRTGLRVDRLNVGSVDYGANAVALGSTTYNPSRAAWMVDWNPSEFSRVRLQLQRDRVREGLGDNQLSLQYQMSLGAHGAHSY